MEGLHYKGFFKFPPYLITFFTMISIDLIATNLDNLMEEIAFKFYGFKTGASDFFTLPKMWLIYLETPIPTMELYRRNPNCVMELIENQELFWEGINGTFTNYHITGTK